MLDGLESSVSLDALLGPHPWEHSPDVAWLAADTLGMRALLPRHFDGAVGTFEYIFKPPCIWERKYAPMVLDAQGRKCSLPGLQALLESCPLTGQVRHHFTSMRPQDAACGPLLLPGLTALASFHPFPHVVMFELLPDMHTDPLDGPAWLAAPPEVLAFMRHVQHARVLGPHQALWVSGPEPEPWNTGPAPPTRSHHQRMDRHFAHQNIPPLPYPEPLHASRILFHRHGWWILGDLENARRGGIHVLAMAYLG